MKNTKYKINLSVEEKEELNRLVRKQSISQSIAKRARLILLVAEEKLQHIEISKKVGIVQSQLPQWIKRWQEANKETEVEERLKDKARSGRKPTITAEQWCKIMALACEKPENHGVPITHWSHSTLTAEIIKQGIVETISMSHVGDFLKKQNYNPIEQSIG
jgi:putative transposase